MERRDKVACPLFQRWLAIDLGTVRIGVAYGVVSHGIASPLEVIAAIPPAAAIDRIQQLAREYNAQAIVVGLPLNMDDTEGPQARLSRTWAVQLAAVCGLEVRLWDERLSSFTADQALAGQMTRKKKKARQDALAAASMLQDFLARRGNETAEIVTAAE